jgi:hypothetical protein
MTGIYFADKGHTRKHGCPNLWPVKTNVFDLVPREVFNRNPIVVFIDPKKVRGSQFQAHFSIFESARVQYTPHWNGEGERMLGGCIMHATYAYKILGVHSNIDMQTSVPIDHVWDIRERAMRSLREALDMYLSYFPET